MSINPNVIVIDAHKSEQKKLKVCAYIRVSTNSDDQINSFKNQLNYYQEYISSKDNWELVDIYADEGISGTSLKYRNDLNRLLTDCRNKKIDMILIKSISRFARNTKESLEMIRELKSLGVSILFEKENIDTSKATDEFLLTLYSQIAQEESISLSKNMKRSYQSRMEQGDFVTTKPPFGYELENGNLVVNTREAEVVKYIFNSYINGMSRKAIAEYMTKTEYKTSNNNEKWSYTTIRRILKNEKYIGDALTQKSFATDTVPPKRVKNKGQKPKYYIKNCHTAIIDRDTFEKAQQLSISRRPPTEVEKSKHEYSEIILCGTCGTIFKRRRCNNIVYWTCRLHDIDSGLCDAKRIREDQINAAFIRMYNKLQVNKHILVQPIIDTLLDMKTKRNLNNQRVVEINKEIAELLEQLKVLNELKSKKYIDSALFISQSDDINNKLKEIRQEKGSYMSSYEDEIINSSKAILDRLNKMPNYIETMHADILAKIVDKIIVVSETEVQFKLINQVCFTETLERIYK